MTLDNFLDDQLPMLVEVGYSVKITRDGRIRLCVPGDDFEFCPITAVVYRKTRFRWPLERPLLAATQIYLPEKVAALIVFASEDGKLACGKTREVQLRIFQSLGIRAPWQSLRPVPLTA